MSLYAQICVSVFLVTIKNSCNHYGLFLKISGSLAGFSTSFSFRGVSKLPASFASASLSQLSQLQLFSASFLLSTRPQFCPSPRPIPLFSPSLWQLQIVALKFFTAPCLPPELWYFTLSRFIPI